MEFVCHLCFDELEAEEELIGCEAVCPSCRGTIVVPTEGDVSLPGNPTATNCRLDTVNLPSIGTLLQAIQPSAEVVPEGERYERGKLVGRGGMGAVIAVEDRYLKRKVAMKLLRDNSFMDPSTVLRFLEEAQITGQLQHPGIIPIHDIGKDDEGHPFYTMKLLDGQTLHAVLGKLRAGDADTEHDWPLGRRLNVFQRICEAMAYAHSRGVIHRDLKPENIIVGEFGEVQVLDWGLAKVLGSDDPVINADPGGNKLGIRTRRADPGSSILVSRNGQVMGTPQYMAPEQAAGQIKKVDQRSDVYGLGAVLFELVHLRAPVRGKTVHQILTAAIRGQIEFPPSGQASLDAVLHKALARNPERRYADAGELQHDVERLTQGFATDAEAAGVWRQLRLLYDRNRALTLTAVTGLLLLMGLGIASTVINRAARVKAENNLSMFETEQEQRNADRQTSGPALAELGRSLMRQNKFDEASKILEIAHDFDPELEGLPMLRFASAVAEENFAEVVSLTDQLPKPLPGELSRAKLADLVTKMRDTEGIAQPRGELQDSLMTLQFPEVAAALAQGHEESEKLVAIWREKLKQAWKHDDPGLSLRSDGGVHLSVSYSNADDSNQALRLDLSPLKGIPLHSLSLKGAFIDLAPLATQTNLKSLILNETQVADLSPLADLPLESFECRGEASFFSLAPLGSTKLQTLSLIEAGSHLEGFEALANLPLESVDIHHCTDLSFLAGQQLKTLHLKNGKGDLSVLASSVTTLKIFYTSNCELFNHQILQSCELDSLRMSDPRRWNPSELDRIPTKGFHIKAPFTTTKTLVSLDFFPVESFEVGQIHGNQKQISLGGLLDERLPNHGTYKIRRELMSKVILDNAKTTGLLMRGQTTKVDEVLDNMAWNIANFEVFKPLAGTLKSYRAHCAAVQSNGWIRAFGQYDGHTYALGMPTFWETANEFAEDLGGHLAYPDRREEHEFLCKQLLQNEQGKNLASAAWLGLIRRAGTKEFLLTNGRAPTFQYWKAGLSPSVRHQWVFLDVKNTDWGNRGSEQLPFIVEWDKVLSQEEILATSF